MKEQNIKHILEEIIALNMYVKSTNATKVKTTVILKDWCFKNKHEKGFINELIFHFKLYLLPSKLESFVEYTDEV